MDPGLAAFTAGLGLAREDRLVLLFRANWPQHRGWVAFIVVVTIAAGGWFVAAGIDQPTWPGGSSLPGFTFGVVGGLIILFEMLLWLKKKVRVWRIGRAQVWMRAHIWLGLLCVPLLILHSGLRLGGTLSTVLMVLLLVVIASGIWGLALQQMLPRRLLDDVPAETIYSQIPHLTAQLTAEAERLVRNTCGPAEGEVVEVLRVPDPTSMASSSHQVIGAVRTVGPVQGKVRETRALATPVPDSEALREFFKGIAAPFLREGRAGATPLHSPNRAAALFQDLRTKVAPAAHPAVAALEGFCNQRRQWDEQRRLHVWLHSWLWVHFPLSVALMVLMFLHVWVALRYW
jgi:hypothetical protein